MKRLIITIITAFPIFVFGQVNKDSIASKLAAEMEMYFNLEPDAEFIGGDSTFQTFWNNNFHLPPYDGKSAIKKKFIAKYVIDENGEVQDVHAHQEGGEEWSPIIVEEIVRVVKLFKYKPARYKGENVSIRVSLPVSIDYSKPVRIVSPKPK